MKQRTALITGVAGQDGVYLARLLRREGYRVLGTVLSIPDARPIIDVYLPDVEIVELDIRNSLGLGRLLDQHRPAEIYNLASWSSVGRSWSDPEQVTAVNGLAVLGMLEQVRNLRDLHGYDPRICQASSSEMFGLASEFPQTEGSPHHPRSPYAVSKSFAHHTCVNYRESYGLFISNAILFNHESPLRPQNFVTRKITSAAAAISLGEQESLKLGRVDIKRDWGAAADVVDAMYQMLRQESPDDFNICTGTSHSLTDFLELAFAAAGIADWESWVEFDSNLLRPVDVPETRGDPHKARSQLSWKNHQSFEDVVTAMVAVDHRRLRTGLQHDPQYLAG